MINKPYYADVCFVATNRIDLDEVIVPNMNQITVLKLIFKGFLSQSNGGAVGCQSQIVKGTQFGFVFEIDDIYCSFGDWLTPVEGQMIGAKRAISLI